MAGDGAHIVPPTGVEGLSLAVSDVVLGCDPLTVPIGEGRSACRCLHGGRVEAGMAGDSLFLVDDLDAPSLR